jgi:CO dehydrogenase maturation factor
VKLAVAGKGGVGKTTIVALLAREAVENGYRVLVVDADPDANLATTLGFPEPIAPLANEEELVAERAGSGGFVRLNPTVDDIPDRYTVERDGIRLIVLGGIRGGGQGCACPANVLLRTLLAHLLLRERDVVLVDMEAGIEHLGRGTTRSVDALILIVESDRKTLETADRTVGLAREIGIERILAVANKVREEEEIDEIRSHLLDEIPIVGAIPYVETIRTASRTGPLPPGRPDGSLRKLFTAIEVHLKRPLP